MACSKCNDTKTIWVECPGCIDPISHERDMLMPKGMICPECLDRYNGKVPVDCPDCTSGDKSEA